MKNLLLTFIATSLFISCNSKDHEIDQSVENNLMVQENYTLKSKVEILNNVIDSLEDKLKENDHSYEENFNLIQEKNKSLLEEISSLKKENSALLTNADPSSEIEKLLKENQALKLDIENLQNNNSALVVAKYIVENKKLMAEKSKMESTFQKLENYTLSLQYVDELKKNNNPTVLTDLRDKIQALEQNYASLEARHKGLLAEKETLNGKIELLDKKYNGAMGSYRSLKLSVENELAAKGISFSLISTAFGDQLILQ